MDYPKPITAEAALAYHRKAKERRNQQALLGAERRRLDAEREEGRAVIQRQATEIERLREALAELEASNEALAATRSASTYLRMIDHDGAYDALARLDDARGVAHRLATKESE